MTKRSIYTCILILCAGHSLHAQRDKVSSLALNAQYGFIFAHSTSVQNTSGARPYAFQVEWSQQFIDSGSWDLCHCHPRQGFLLNYTNFDVGILGHGLQLGYYLEPSFFIGKKLESGVRAVAGLSAGSRPFHPLHNPTNQSYSTLINGYLALGLHASWRLHPSWQLMFFAQYNHTSNGGLKDPNKGINWPTAGVGARYYPKTFALPDYSERKPPAWKNRHYADVAAFYSSRVIRPGEKRRYSIYGIEAQFVYASGRIHAWTIGGELSHDMALKERMQRAGLRAHSGMLAGVALGHEFLLGRFVFGQELGIYASDYGPYYNLLYHRWSLWRRLNKRLGAGISMKAHGSVANFLDARLVYTIKGD